MARVFAALFGFVIAGVSFAQDSADSIIDPELSSMIISFFPAGTGEVLMIVFSSIAAMNALSITLEKIAKRTKTPKDDAAVSKFRGGLLKVQKVLNFFIAK